LTHKTQKKHPKNIVEFSLKNATKSRRGARGVPEMRIQMDTTGKGCKIVSKVQVAFLGRSKEEESEEIPQSEENKEEVDC